METFLNGAMLIEGGLLSFLLALWMTWLALHGLFLLLPGTSVQAAGRGLRPIRLTAHPRQGNRQREAA